MHRIAIPDTSSVARATRGLTGGAIALAILLAAAPTSAQEPSFPGDSVILEMLRPFAPDGAVSGIVVGLLEPGGGRRVIAYGNGGADAGPLHGESVLEIGSITKVFTGVLLADMVRRGEVELSEPFARLLPAGVRVPSRNEREITVLDVITHTSGLPAMPTNFPAGDEARATETYTVDRMVKFLADYELPRIPGESYEYSNLVALLGYALAERAGTPYGALLGERILIPLGMEDTAIEPTPQMERQRAAGHDVFGDPAPDFVAPAFVASGGLRSTVHDMLTFAEASLSAMDTPVHAALRYAQLPQREIGGDDGYMGLGWATGPIGDGYTTAHTGGTFGYSASIRLNPVSRRAVVVLANFAGDVANPIGLHLLFPESFPRPLPSVATAIAPTIRQHGIAAAVKRYRALRAAEPDRWRFDEAELNTLGYRLLARDAPSEAIEIFRLNVEMFPSSPNTHDSLGDAYRAASRLDEAIASYRAAVRLAEETGHPNLPVYRANLGRALDEGES